MNIIKALFGKTEEKQNMSDIFVGGTLSTSNYIYTTNLELYNEFYKKNTDVRAAEDDIAKLVFEGGYYFKDKQGNKIEDEKINNKLNTILNSFLDFEIWKNLFITQTDIFGNVFVYLARNESGELVGLQILDPRNIEIKKDKFGRETGYLIGGNKTIFTTDQIKHYYNATDLLKTGKGLSKLETLTNEILSDIEISQSNLGYFKTGRLPKTLVIFENGISQEQKKALFKQLKEYFKGGENNYKVGSFDGIKEIKQVQDDFDGTLFNGMRDFNTQRILKALGVPLIRLHDQNAKYSNQKEIYIQYIDGTIRPKEKALAKFINKILWQEFNGLYTFVYNDERLIDQLIKSEVVINKKNGGLITINEGRKELGYDESEEEEANKLIVNKNSILLEDLGIEGFQQEKIDEEI